MIVDLFWGYALNSNGTVLNPDGSARKQYRDPAGYWKVSLHNPHTGGRKQFYIHRMLGLNFVHNPCPGVFTIVDHIDQNKGNNDLSNLRWVTHQLNVLNNDAKNVYFIKKWGKWVAQVCRKTLGYFKKREDATACAKKHKSELFERIYKWHVENYDARSWVFSSLTSNRCPILSY